METESDVWMFRERFTGQLATVSFISYLLHMANRLPHTIGFVMDTANVMRSDLYMSMLFEGLPPSLSLFVSLSLSLYVCVCLRVECVCVCISAYGEQAVPHTIGFVMDTANVMRSDLYMSTCF